YWRAVRKVQQPLQQARGLAALVLGGDATFYPELVAKQNEVEQAIGAADAVEQRLGDRLRTAEAWGQFKKDWQALKGKAGRLNAEDAFAQYTQLLEQLTNLSASVGESAAL